MFDEIISKSKSFFEKALLPELVAKYFTEKISSEVSKEIKGCCACNLPENEDDLIHCGEKECLVKKFHLKCVRVKKIPKGKWFCSDCKGKRNVKKLERKKKKKIIVKSYN